MTAVPEPTKESDEPRGHSARLGPARGYGDKIRSGRIDPFLQEIHQE